MSQDIVTEQITLMGDTLLCSLLQHTLSQYHSESYRLTNVLDTHLTRLIFHMCICTVHHTAK